MVLTWCHTDPLGPVGRLDTASPRRICIAAAPTDGVALSVDQEDGSCQEGRRGEAPTLDEPQSSAHQRAGECT